MVYMEFSEINDLSYFFVNLTLYIFLFCISL